MDKSAVINQLHQIASSSKLTAEGITHFPTTDVRFEHLACSIIDCPPLLDAIKAKVVGDSLLSIKITCDTGDAERPNSDVVNEVSRLLAAHSRPVPQSPMEVGTLIHEAIEAGLTGYPDERVLRSAPGYEQLVEVLAAAHDQAAYGKGKERHANGLPFHEQRMQGISDLVGSPDGMLYQLVKKTTEGLQFDNPQKREHELLGAINYLAGIIIWLRRHEAVAERQVV